MNLEDNCFLNLENKYGANAFLHASCTEWKNKFLFEIFCEFGKIEINGLGKSYGEEKLILYKMTKKMGKPLRKDYKFSRIDLSWKKELEEFYTDITKKENLVQTLMISIKIYK